MLGLGFRVLRFEVSFSLNPLKGGYMEDYQEDTSSLDYISNGQYR